ncbi:hypothetical protein [Nocardia sp. A7]|uniref:hypothetical protein n=1 Tax=Nocardia sp. A7 TaxID=2789274 RepID=UPI0039781097
MSTDNVVDDLAQRVTRARAQVAHQDDPALTAAYSPAELDAERDLAESIRRLDREQRRAEATTAAAAAARVRRTGDAIAAIELRDELAAAAALAAHRRAASPTAQLADLHRYRVWAGRALGGVVAAGMAWSAVNVQQNIAGGAPVTDPLFWFSYLIEAMISVCLIVVMAGAPRLAGHGITVSRRTLTAAELALLALTVVLNTYPHLSDGHFYDAAVHAVAPAMIAIALAIHHAMSTRVAAALANAAPAATTHAAAAPAAATAPAPAPAAAPAAATSPATAPRATTAPAAASAPVTAPAAAPAATTAPTPAPVRVHARPSVRELAEQLIQGGIRTPIDQVTAIIAAADADIEAGHTRPRVTRIATANGVGHNTVKRILTAAADIRGAGAQVITLHAASQP